jgi:hypothetical protein
VKIGRILSAKKRAVFHLFVQCFGAPILSFFLSLSLSLSRALAFRDRPTAAHPLGDARAGTPDTAAGAGKAMRAWAAAILAVAAVAALPLPPPACDRALAPSLISHHHRHPSFTVYPSPSMSWLGDPIALVSRQKQLPGILAPSLARRDHCLRALPCSMLPFLNPAVYAPTIRPDHSVRHRGVQVTLHGLWDHLSEPRVAVRWGFLGGSIATLRLFVLMNKLPPLDAGPGRAAAAGPCGSGGSRRHRRISLCPPGSRRGAGRGWRPAARRTRSLNPRRNCSQDALVDLDELAAFAVRVIWIWVGGVALASTGHDSDVGCLPAGVSIGRCRPGAFCAGANGSPGGSRGAGANPRRCGGFARRRHDAGHAPGPPSCACRRGGFPGGLCGRRCGPGWLTHGDRVRPPLNVSLPR